MAVVPSLNQFVLERQMLSLAQEQLLNNDYVDALVNINQVIADLQSFVTQITAAEPNVANLMITS